MDINIELEGLYKTVSDSYIMSKLPSDKMDLLYVPAYNLSSILGDKNGRLPKTVSVLVVNSLRVIPPNKLYVASDMSLVNLHPYLPDEVYIPELFITSYNLLSLLKAGNSEYVYDGDQYSPLLSQVTTQCPQLIQPVSQIYLDSYSLYINMLNNTVSTITLTEIQRLCSNISWISSTVEDLSYIPFTLLEILRSLQRTLNYISSIYSNIL